MQYAKRPRWKERRPRRISRSEHEDATSLVMRQEVEAPIIFHLLVADIFFIFFLVRFFLLFVFIYFFFQKLLGKKNYLCSFPLFFFFRNLISLVKYINLLFLSGI